MSRPRRHAAAPDRFGEVAADVDALLGSESDESDRDGSRGERVLLGGWSGAEGWPTPAHQPPPLQPPPTSGTPRPPDGGIYVYRLLRTKDLEGTLKGRTVR